jgi:hypothetical protein
MEGGSTAATFAEILAREQVRLARLCWKWLALFFVLTSVPPIYLDLNYWWVDIAYVWVGFLSWAAGYLLLVVVMDRAEIRRVSGVGTYFVITAITGTAILVGLIAFVLPAIFLLVRWLPTFVRCLSSEEWIGKSMRWSWNATEPFQKELALASLGPVAGFLTIALVSWAYDASGLEYWRAYVAMSIGFHVIDCLAYAWLTVLGVAAYLAIEQAGTARTVPAGG